MLKRSLVVALLLLLVQAPAPLLVCFLQVGRCAYLCGAGFHADPLDGFYCGNYVAMFWPLTHATAYAAVLAGEGGAAVFLTELARRTFGQTRRGLAVATSVPLLLAVLVVPNFFYAVCLVETRSYVDALTLLHDFFRGFSELRSGVCWISPLFQIVPISLGYAVFLEIAVVAEWRGLRQPLVAVACAVWILAAWLIEGLHVALVACLCSAALLVAARLREERPALTTRRAQLRT